jgi:polysaccharide chain length determinant protein (PEP-CTERM system associated)
VTSRISDQAGRSGFDFVLELWARRKWTALIVFTTVVAGIVSLTLSLPDLYRASATVLIERQQVSETIVRPSVTAELETRIQMIQQELMARTRLTDLITRFDLYQDLRKKGLPFEVIVERMRRDVQMDLKGVEQQMSGRNATIAFAISYSGKDRQTVSNVANALATLYVDENTKSREGQAIRTAEFLRAQLTEVKNELDAQARRSSEFKLQHMGELPQQVEANLASLERLNTQLRLNGENQIRALDRRERLEKQLGDADTGSSSQGIMPAPLSSSAQQLAKLTQQLVDLRRQFTDEYPDVVRVRTEIAVLERQLSRATPVPVATAPAPPDPVRRLKQELSDVAAEITALKDEERVLRQTIGGFEQRVENAPKRQEEFKDLSSGYESTKDRYDALLKRYEEARLAESLEQSQRVEQFRILDPALPPREPAAPPRGRLILLGCVVALGLAFAAMMIADKLDTTFHGVDDLRAFVNVPVLLSIPMIETASATRRRRQRMALAAISVVVGLTLIVAGSHYVADGNDTIVRLLAGGRA